MTVRRIIVSVVYSYEIIRQSAFAAQAQIHWASNEKVKDLQFSSTWVKSFLRRANMRRRKITTEDKNIPSEADIQSEPLDIHETLIRHLKEDWQCRRMENAIIGNWIKKTLAQSD